MARLHLDHAHGLGDIISCVVRNRGRLPAGLPHITLLYTVSNDTFRTWYLIPGSTAIMVSDARNVYLSLLDYKCFVSSPAVWHCWLFNFSTLFLDMDGAFSVKYKGNYSIIATAWSRQDFCTFIILELASNDFHLHASCGITPKYNDGTKKTLLLGRHQPALWATGCHEAKSAAWTNRVIFYGMYNVNNDFTVIWLNGHFGWSSCNKLFSQIASRCVAWAVAFFTLVRGVRVRVRVTQLYPPARAVEL